MTLTLAWASSAAMRYACKNWHYSHATPPPPSVAVGVWEDDRFCGVVVFSRGASPNIGRPFGLQQTEVVELTRVALREHETPVSRIVSIAIKLVHRSSPRLRMLVSYADPEQGHHGGIYQAMNWTYLGTTPTTRWYIDKNGRRWHSRMVSPSGTRKVYGRTRSVVRQDECEVHVAPGKHRYALALDPSLAPMLDERAQPYPRAAVPTEGIR
jgi:hypothetical protein